ncbi:MAG: division/cell wall cluster transcriptional repressor MraZ [Gammaproteobacteria bacterium]|nr:division/cell wall cluster transcriptional repressor MraZ [Gammaproteobacteria bacterium]
MHLLGLFRGASNLSLDDKGRLTMPSRYRELITNACDGNLIMTVDPDECLLLYPYEEWLEVEKSLAALPSLNKQARSLKRLLMGYAQELTMDKNGRLLVPPPLREFANIEKQIVLIGQGNKFEIWNEDYWQSSTKEWVDDHKQKNELIGDLESLSF